MLDRATPTASRTSRSWLTGAALGYAALAFADLAVSPRCAPYTLCLLAAVMNVAESLVDLLCNVRAAFI